MPPSAPRPTFNLSRFDNPDANHWAAHLAHVDAGRTPDPVAAAALAAANAAADAMELVVCGPRWARRRR